MRLSITKSKHQWTYYVIRSVKRDGKRSSEVVQRLGTAGEIMDKYGCSDPTLWAKAYVAKLNEEEKNQNTKVFIPFNTNEQIPLNEMNSHNVGYLFLQQIYHELGLPSICKKISKEHDFEYDLNEILSRLVYGRILYPSSKLSCYEQSQKLLEPPAFELHNIYRALSVIANESDEIQASLYKNSRELLKRKTGVLYYDCTNFFFEIEQEEGLKKYGPSKEHRPNPIVQMGLFMDATGIPLAFCINQGNQNEQLSLKPLERQIMKDFELSKFVVCTDAGLSSDANRKFNNFGERSFITTQSIKKLNKKLKEWALSPIGWHVEGSHMTFNIDELEDTPENRKKIFYKQRIIEGYDEERDIEFNQNLIVTFSLKYKNYQRNIRNQQIQRALNAMENHIKLDKVNQNDYKRFIKKTAITPDGEIAENMIYEINEDAVLKEAMYDGFYAVCTNLLDDPMDIIKVNQSRWEIEESFRILKSDFKARPVYLKRDDRIKAHFMTCFIALLIYRILEKKLDEEFTSDEIITALKEMNVTKIAEEGYVPAYRRTDLTDALHEMAGFHTDYQLIPVKSMKGIIRKSKNL